MKIGIIAENLLKSFSRDALVRRNARWFLLNRLAIRNDFRLSVPNTKPWQSVEFQEVMSSWKESSYNQKAFNLYFLAKGCKGIEGDTVECGVYQGRGSYLIRQAICDDSKSHHVFDSFEGLSLPSEKDRPNGKDIETWCASDMRISLQIVKENLRGLSNIKYWRGWIPNRFAEVRNGRFSFVHIDVDLYEPTRESVRFFYPRINAGGMIVCDDYGSIGTPGAREAMDEFFSDKPEVIIELSSGQGVVIKE